jgi:Glycosyl hydrolases family 18
MSNELYIAYWSGEEPTGPGKSPTLDMTPDYVDVVVLFYVIVEPGDVITNALNFSRLVLHNDQQTIMGWMQDIRQRQKNNPKKTKFTLGLLGGDNFSGQDPVAFAGIVKGAYDEWGVDGITVDYEPPNDASAMVPIVQAIRGAIGPDAIMTAPIYTAWYGQEPVLKQYAEAFNYIETMDYTPYIGLSGTTDAVTHYAEAIGTSSAPAYDKIAIGVSCMEPPDDFTPLADVVSLCQWEPPNGGRKLGIMLYTLSYDVTSHGSGYPDGTFTETIHENLP